MIKLDEMVESIKKLGMISRFWQDEIELQETVLVQASGFLSILSNYKSTEEAHL
jgi:hypothetical protein